ncbi:hypothetical protein BH09PSE4_BH09PSE4_23460 [soil metagenome]
MTIRRIPIALALLIAGAAVPAQAPRLAALSSIETGEWTLKEIGGEGRSLCLSDPRTLIQLRHGNAQCTRFVISDDPHSVTVHYTCPGAGHGRTTITVETSRLIKVETQGIAGGAPFESTYEGRRTGACG